MHKLAMLIMILLCPALAAADSTGSDANLLSVGPRPQIEDYENRDDFVKDILAWKKRQKAWEKHSAELSASPGTARQEHDWHHVTGPENLDTALHNAEGYVQPDYKQTYRFNRTTHISFPLSRLERDQLAEKRVEAPESAGEPAVATENLSLDIEKTIVAEPLMSLENQTAQQARPRIRQGAIVETRLD